MGAFQNRSSEALSRLKLSQKRSDFHAPNLARDNGRECFDPIEPSGPQGNPPILRSDTQSDQCPSTIKIGTRGSPLALAQARELQDRLAAAHRIEAQAIRIVVIKTSGDLILDRSLSEAGGKGLFTKELDLALASGEVDIAVHSAKDLPTVLPDGIAIAGYLAREDVRDAWICPRAAGPRDLPPGSVVGTASLRRGAMVKRLRPDLSIVLLRGNVETRLAKLAGGEIDATLLALAGLRRLGLEARATAVLDAREFVPAAGQGAIAITLRADDLAARAALAPILDAPTGLALAAERAFLHVLDGSCKTPIGAYARLEQDGLTFQGIVLKPDGSRFFEIASSGSPAEATAIGEAAGRALLAQIPPDFFKV